MYIPYEKIGALFKKVTNDESVSNFFYNRKILQNVSYIEKNKPKVLKRLNKKLLKGEKLNVVFYVYDETKWKCQSLYDLLLEDERFTVKVLVTKTACLNKDNPSYITNDSLKKTYDFFKQIGVKVELAYDVNKLKFMPFKKFKPDIIFYQHPWYVKTEQGPVVCSKFALTAYVPYYFPIETAGIDCNLRFHQYIENYYVFDEYTKNKYLRENPKLGKTLKVAGYPYLDYFVNRERSEGDCIIYAPHWTVGGEGLAYSTFEWSGQFMLEYAKSHPEIKWVFKPHPLLKKALVDTNTMTVEEVESYYAEWNNLGVNYEGGNYLEFFAKSKMMITDCSSFLGEYFITEKPLIHLMSKGSQFRTSDNPILKTYYRADNLD